MTEILTRRLIAVEDIDLATGGTGADETFTEDTADGYTLNLTKPDASHLKFRTAQGGVAKSVEDLVDGGKDVHLKPKDLSMDGTLTNASMDTAGYVKNNASGVFSGGNTILAADLPTAIDSAKLADGSVNNTEFQYLNGVTSAIQTQLNTIPTIASQADQEAGTEATKYVTPAIQQFHPSASKAWCKFQPDATKLKSYNIASVTEIAAGRWDLAFLVDFSDADFVVVSRVTQAAGTSIRPATPETQAAGTVRIITTDDVGTLTETEVTAIHVACFGDQ